MPMQNFVSGLKNNQKGEEKMSRYEEILNSQFKMTDGGRVDYVKDLYTTYCPEVDLQAMIDGGYIDALGDMMEPVLISLDDRSPEVMAYWAKHGMVKEFHGDNNGMNWEAYENKTGYKWVRTEKKVYNDEKVVLATGGKSYPMTGSNGDGYILAKKMGHTITEIRPSLVALTSKNESLEVCQALQGLSLKNVGVKLIKNGKNIYEDFGEMLFTHFGVSGPTILSSSSHLVRKGIENTKLVIDLKPALSDEKLDERIIRDFNEEKNKEFKNSLEKLLPKKLIPVIISKMGLEKKVNEVTKEERKKLVNILKRFEIEISGFRPVEEAIVTAGGVSIKEINPKTMESKLVKGLYFAGEIIDVDAYTGGFNLQIAYSTGYTAGLGM